MKLMKIICSECGREFSPGNRPDGMPNGVAFVLEDGTVYNACADCIMKHGMEVIGNENKGENNNISQEDT